jgi:hypothetical protein
MELRKPSSREGKRVLVKMKYKQGSKVSRIEGFKWWLLFLVFHLNPRTLESLNPNRCRLEKNTRDLGQA